MFSYDHIFEHPCIVLSEETNALFFTNRHERRAVGWKDTRKAAPTFGQMIKHRLKKKKN